MHLTKLGLGSMAKMYAGIMVLFALISGIMMILASLITFEIMAIVMAVVMAIIAVIAAAIAGAISGAIMAIIFNVVASKTGGIEIELNE